MIFETVVYDGRLKEWRILNLTTGSIYSSHFESEDAALLAIEDGQVRGDLTVKRITRLEIVTRLMTDALLASGDSE